MHTLALALIAAGCVTTPRAYDVVVVGGTPGGIMAAIGAARGGRTVAILDRNTHLGGLPANGLGATDISTRGATTGLFKEFVDRVKAHYFATYGKDSPEARDCSDGYHFEPSVAEKIFQQMLSEHPRVTVLRERQLDARPENVAFEEGRLAKIAVTHRPSNGFESYAAKVFVDATYEGDLAAAAGAPFRTRREAASEHREPLAGRVYKTWGGPVGDGSTGAGDDSLQAYNYRLCLTDRPENSVPIPRPAGYDRQEFASLVEDVTRDRTAGRHRDELAFDGIGRIVNMVRLPKGKTDANNQHLAFISTDLPEENWPWPTADWTWRDRFAGRLRDYTLGLLWFAQNDPALPESFRTEARRWGLAKDEYADNGHFPRQAYVREGRRIEGEHLFTAHDSIPIAPGGRPPIHATSITASHYPVDSHAVRKREPGRSHLDGFLSHPTQPYTVPYGVIVPRKVEGLLTPVPVSATHLGFGTLRMEPCWMALGQAAGVAAHLSIADGVRPRRLDPSRLQRELVRQKATLIYYRDVPADHPLHEAVQHFGLRGLISGWHVRADEPVTDEDADRWCASARVKRPAGVRTRGELLAALYRAIHMR